MKNQEVDIVIVGAGISGCYAGFRLTYPSRKVSEERARIAIFEENDTVGGRLMSLSVSCSIAEMGGMRFFDQTPILSDLLSHLALYNIKKFSMDVPENPFFARGVCIRRRDLKTNNSYSLLKKERGKEVRELIDYVTIRYLPRLNTLRNDYHDNIEKGQHDKAKEIVLSYEKMKSECMVKDRNLSSLSWRAFLEAGLSKEAMAFIQDADGYEIMESCGSALYWLDNIFYSPPNSPMKRLADGFQRLPHALAEIFIKNGGILNLSHKLISFSKTKEKYLLQFKTNDKLISIISKKIILAVPKPALQMLSGQKFFFNKIDQFFFQSAKSVNAFKLFLIYPFAWWEKFGIVDGRGTTDLPLRQFYYIPQEKYSSNTTRGLIMASYCNGPDADYWIRLINEFNQGLLITVPPAQREAIIKDGLKDRAHRMLMQIHANEILPLPIDAYYQVWDERAGNAGWHVWDTGSRASEAIIYMQQPIKKENIFIVGECWSKHPGSVQGSLATTEAVLQCHFHLKLPEWMTGPRWDL